MVSFAYKLHTYPSLSLINNFIDDNNIDKTTSSEYRDWYFRYKAIENKYLNGFRLNEDEVMSHLDLGQKLEHLLHIINIYKINTNAQVNFKKIQKRIEGIEKIDGKYFEEKYNELDILIGKMGENCRKMENYKDEYFSIYNTKYDPKLCDLRNKDYNTYLHLYSEHKKYYHDIIDLLKLIY